jgi:hypothetical protein
MLIPIQDELPVPNISLLLLTEDIPAGPPIPTVNPFEDAQLPVLLPPAPNGSTTPTNALAFTSKYFTATFAAGLLSLRDFSDLLTSQNTYRQYLYFTLAGGKTNLFPSNAYIAPHPEIKFDVKANGAAISGVGLTSFILGLDSKALTNVISNALFQSAGNVLDNKQIPPEVTSQAALFALSVLEKISLASALPALGLLGGAGDIDPALLADNPAVAGALGLANLQALNAFLDSGALETELKGFLTEAGFSEAEIAKVLPILTSAVTIGLTQTVISQLAVSLGLPGLLPQILGNLPGSNLQDQVILAQAKQFGDILSDGTNVVNLKSDLLAELIKKDNIDRSIALSQINKAVNETLANPNSFSNADDLRADLQRNLIAQGVNENTASDLAQQAVDFVQAEQQLPDLPTLLVKDDILKSDVLTSNRFSDIISDQNLQNAVNQSFVQGEATKRDFRNALVAQLVQQGTDRANANLIATELLLSVQSDAIKNSFSIDRVNRDVLLKSLITNPDDPNAANIIAATNATFALVPKTELEFREILTRQLETFNVDRLAAIELAKNAAIAQANNDPLRSVNASNFLTRDQLATQLIANFSEIFNGNVNGRTVTNLASQLTLAIIGPVLAPEYQADQIRRTNSVLSRLGDAYIQFKNTHVIETDREVAANFTDFIAPKTTDSFALITPILTGMSLFLLFAGLMYEGMGRKPSNFKENIDIPI